MRKKVNINISYSAVFIASAIIIFGSHDLILPLICAALVHEMGHIAAIILLGGRINTLSINAGGLKILYETKTLSYKNDLICALAGPALGLISAVIASKTGFTVYSGISLCINTFNLLPIRPLDGGRILWNLLSMIFTQEPNNIMSVIEVVIIAALFCISTYIFVLTKSFALIFITCVLTFYYCKER